jgi:hypothetical protein
VTQVTANGNTYSDDRTAAKDMNDGGSRTHLVPMLSDVMTEISGATSAAADAEAAAASAAAYAAALYGTSTTSVAVGTGSKSWTTQTGKQFSVGVFLTIARTAAPTNWMVGQVTAYNSGTGALTVNVTGTNGSGTYTDWTINVSGAQGATGLTGPAYVQARSTKTGAYTLVAGDLGNLIDCTSGTFTLAFTAAATLTSSWWCEIRNSGTGDVTLDPNSTEQIDGLTSFVMYPGEHRRVFCTGTAFVTLVINPFYFTATASGNWIEPPGYKLFDGLLWGAGGGGGRSGSGSFVAGGGGGGGCTPIHRPAASAGSTVSFTLAAATTSQTSAANGANGGDSTFGTVTAKGGGGGYGNGAASGVGGGGGGPITAGTAGATGTAAVAGGRPGTEYSGNGYDSDGLGGAMSAGNAAWGGAGGGGNTSTIVVAGAAVHGGGGGGRGAGSSVTAGSSIFGGAGGAGSSATNGTAGTAPGGGGGGTQTGTQGGAGGRGELRIWGVV